MSLNSRCYTLGVTAQLMMHLLLLPMFVLHWLEVGPKFGAPKMLDFEWAKGGISIHLVTKNRLYLDCTKGGS
jgi:hypothetical protein